MGLAVRFERNVVLVKRKHAPGKDLWAFPGGHVEVGEEIQAAAVREAAEELNVKVKILKLLDCVDYIERDEQGRVKYHFVLVDYLAEIVSGRIKAGSDVEEILLASQENIETLPILPLTKKFIHKHIHAIFES